MTPALNIALLGRDFPWGGGAELLRNIANALLSARTDRKTRIFLLLPIKNRVDTFADARRIALNSMVSNTLDLRARLLAAFDVKSMARIWDNKVGGLSTSKPSSPI